MATSIYWPTKVIYVPRADMSVIQASPEIRELDLDTFRLDLKDLEDDWEGMPFPYTHNHNTEVTLSGLTYARIIEITNGYTVEFEDGQYTVSCTGANHNLSDVKVANQVSLIINNAAGLIVTEVGSGVTEQDKLDIADQVWDEDMTTHNVVNSSATALKAGTYGGYITLDPAGGTAGTGWPIGTHFKPSSNLTDALTIMFYGHVDELMLESDLTITASHDVGGKLIVTSGTMGTTITFETGARSDKTAIRYANVEGVIYPGDEMLMESCSVLSLTGFKGVMNNVDFGQGSEVSFDTWATIIQGTAGGEPTNEVEFNIGTAAVNISGWTGPLKLTNKTGTDRTIVNCNSGNIIIDSTCTAGKIQLLGVGILEADNSGAGCSVDTDGFVTNEFIADHVWNESAAAHIAAGTFGGQTNEIFTDMARALGLMQENYYLDQTSYTNYNGQKLLTSGRMRIYSVAGSVGTANDVIGTYTITSVWSNDELQTYQVVKQ